MDTFLAYRRSARAGYPEPFQIEIERDDATVYYTVAALAFGENAQEVEREIALEQFDDFFMRVHWREHGWPVREIRLTRPSFDGEIELVARIEIESC